ncbi:MAG TPA: putative zinc-binding peptidase [Rhodoblastus sp.]|nr:putative zinc-binding peptidase [Rhodoblastus sp.]
MRLYPCQSCGNTVHFENSTCVACGAQLAYAPDLQEMTALVPDGISPDGVERVIALADRSRAYRLCANAGQNVCNWLVPLDEGQALCRSCRHNRLSPDLSVAGNQARWRRIEQAKRHLFYSLLKWSLPTPTAAEGAPEPLVFNLIGDVETDQGVERVLTGHDLGEITLNIAEADNDEREKRRVAMGEPYRTLLGHFRHEIGHYYWDLLVRDGGQIDAFRSDFGDERADYGEALKAHYAQGAPGDWPLHFISAYATAHPWEDFAETWAHYVHIVDTLDTAGAYGVSLRPVKAGGGDLAVAVDFNAYRAQTIREIVAAWAPVSVALNSLNRSLGQPDPYPFVLTETVIGKFDFIHRLIHAQQAPMAVAAQ